MTRSNIFHGDLVESKQHGTVHNAVLQLTQQIEAGSEMGCSAQPVPLRSSRTDVRGVQPCILARPGRVPQHGLRVRVNCCRAAVWVRSMGNLSEQGRVAAAVRLLARGLRDYPNHVHLVHGEGRTSVQRWRRVENFSRLLHSGTPSAGDSVLLPVSHTMSGSSNATATHHPSTPASARG